MKYGMRERISGIVIIVALAIILLPMMFGRSDDDQASSPGTSMTIEQPIDMARREVSPPDSPLSGSAVSEGEADRQDVQASQSNQLFPDRNRDEAPAENTRSRGAEQSSKATASSTGAPSSSSAQRSPSGESKSGSVRQEQTRGDDSSGDPIMAAANRNSTSASRAATSQPSGSGGWAVQAGSFGQAANADRLIQQLRDQGFSAYQQPRGELHTVYVGPYSSNEESERARTQLQQKANIKGLIVRREGGQ